MMSNLFYLFPQPGRNVPCKIKEMRYLLSRINTIITISHNNFIYIGPSATVVLFTQISR
jgi:hypothetical protein